MKGAGAALDGGGQRDLESPPPRRRGEALASDKLLTLSGNAGSRRRHGRGLKAWPLPTRRLLVGSAQSQAPAFRDKERLRVSVPTAAPGNSGVEPRGARRTDAHTRRLRPQGPRRCPLPPREAVARACALPPRAPERAGRRARGAGRGQAGVSGR